jgi:hypothetical protein
MPETFEDTGANPMQIPEGVRIVEFLITFSARSISRRASSA